MEQNKKNTEIKTIKIGTRNSPLALAQTQEVIDAVLQNFPEINFEIVPIITKGDQVHHRPLRELYEGGKSAFSSELQEALKLGIIDVAVHSMKDIAGNIKDENLIFAAFLPRKSADDVIISKQKYNSISEIPSGHVVGTVSLRRRNSLLRSNPNLVVKNLRGNIQTRIEKLRENHTWKGHVKITYDAIIMAKAAIERSPDLDLTGLYVMDIPAVQMLPAAGQGIIAVETCVGNDKIVKIFSAINHKETAICARAERELLYLLNGNCHSVIGVNASIDGDNIILSADISNDANDQAKTYYVSVSYTHTKEKPKGCAKKLFEILKQKVIAEKGLNFWQENLNISPR